MQTCLAGLGQYLRVGSCWAGGDVIYLVFIPALVCVVSVRGCTLALRIFPSQHFFVDTFSPALGWGAALLHCCTAVHIVMMAACGASAEQMPGRWTPADLDTELSEIRSTHLVSVCGRVVAPVQK